MVAFSWSLSFEHRFAGVPPSPVHQEREEEEEEKGKRKDEREGKRCALDARSPSAAGQPSPDGMRYPRQGQPSSTFSFSVIDGVWWCMVRVVSTTSPTGASNPESMRW